MEHDRDVSVVETFGRRFGRLAEDLSTIEKRERRAARHLPKIPSIRNHRYARISIDRCHFIPRPRRIPLKGDGKLRSYA